MKFLIQILKLDGAGASKVLVTFAHSAKSLEIVRQTMRGVQQSAEWPSEANAYRIAWAEGAETHHSEINYSEAGTS